ncbi:MAG: flagellar motor protein MotB [Rhodospirillales bacterium]|jgi:chemotaxis protein MotB|nr:flagellar motor protein MotB [Rhodospirillales bacterium]|tara:strand:- start:367 stop:1071 length:705 start_codon:yes stop_codon:yes gene_type:complete
MANDPRNSPAQPSAIWLLTFTDLVALLLTFFVMLFSMSNVKVDRWKEMIDALSQTLNPARTEPIKVPSAEYNISSVFRKRAINLDYLTAVLNQKIERSEVLKSSQLVTMEDRLIISLPGTQLFQAESAALSRDAGAALFDLGGVLRHIDNQIGVNGYSEEEKFSGTEYKSDWELSLARAVAVANALKRAGYDDQIVSFGFGNTRSSKLKDIAAEKRRLLSRRIDIVIMATGGDI